MERSLLALSPPTRWIGRRLDIHREVDSTNLVAERLARAGAPEGLLVVADAQSAGRGRLGRSFFSPGGRSLYMSLLLRPEASAAPLPQYVFAASLAVAETVLQFLRPSARVEIKWPNDVLIDGRKTSGINLPAHVEAGQVSFAVLGIGVNLNLRREELPPELRPLATSLLEARGEPIDRIEFAEALLLRLEEKIDCLRSAGFGPVLEGWKKYFRMQGERVRVGGPGMAREIEGCVEGLDPDGALLIRSDTGLERILAGDVTLISREARTDGATGD